MAVVLQQERPMEERLRGSEAILVFSILAIS